MVPGGSGGATIGKTIFTYVYIEKNLLLQNQQANFNQTWHRSSLGKVEVKIVQIKGQVFFKGEIITKMQKWGGVIEKSSSPEPLSQNRLYLHENFVI